MNVKSMLGFVLAAGVAAGFAAGCATPVPKVGKAEATQAALTKAPDGMVKECQLERERGRLVWSFDIARPGTQDVTEVLVDATSGQVVAVEIEDLAKQAKEQRQEAGKKK